MPVRLQDKDFVPGLIFLTSGRQHSTEAGRALDRGLRTRFLHAAAGFGTQEVLIACVNKQRS